MKVIRKCRKICLFKELEPGDVFRFSETGSLFMKITNPYGRSLNGLDIEKGILQECYSTDEIIPVDGYFIEGEMVTKHDT